MSSGLPAEPRQPRQNSWTGESQLGELKYLACSHEGLSLIKGQSRAQLRLAGRLRNAARNAATQQQQPTHVGIVVEAEGILLSVVGERCHGGGSSHGTLHRRRTPIRQEESDSTSGQTPKRRTVGDGQRIGSKLSPRMNRLAGQFAPA